MTVALGLVCSDGVVVASDSMGSSDMNTASINPKVAAFQHNPVVWTHSGAVYVREEVADAIATKMDDKEREIFTGPQRNLLRGDIKRVVHPVVGRCYKDALCATPFPAGGIPGNLQSSFLFAGFANGEPWLIEFDPQGSLNWHTEDGFYAIGSGGSFATVCYGLMKHYIQGEPLSLEQGQMLAYRAIETTCEVSTSSVGPPVQLAVADAAGSRLLDSDEVSKIGDAVLRWKELERESLRIGDDVVDAPEDLPTMDEGPDVAT